MSQYQKGNTNLDFTEARDSEWQWHHLGHMQLCTSPQTDNHASTPPLSFYRSMPFLPPNQQRQALKKSNTCNKQEAQLKQGLADRTAKTAVSAAI